MAYPQYNQFYPQYQQPYQYQQPQPQAQNPQMNTNNQPQIQNGGVIINIPSEADARSFPVALGNSITFKDENAPYIYVKTMGFSQLDRPVFDKYRLVKEEAEIVQKDPKTDSADKISLEDLEGQIEAIKGEISDIKKKIAPKTAKKIVKETEIDEDDE